MNSAKNLSSIEDSGIFEKYEGDDNGDVYQFKHLVLQEFLSAIYILNTFTGSEIYQMEDSFPNSILNVFGLLGLLSEKSLASPYLKAFAKAVINVEQGNSEEVLEQYFKLWKSSEIEFGSLLPGNMVDLVHEYNCELPEFAKKCCLELDLDIDVEHQYQLDNLIYFLQSIKVRRICSVAINGLNFVSKERFFRLAPHLVTAESVTFFGTYITNEGYEALSKCICEAHRICNNMLKELILCECNLTDDDLEKLSDAIPYLTTLRLIYNRNITSTGYKAFSKRICDAHHKGGNNMLKELLLQGSFFYRR